MRDAVVDFVAELAEATELPIGRILGWAALQKGRFYDWRKRYGKANEHNGQIPRDHWLEDAERQAILDYHDKHPLNGYRRLTYMMMDADVVAVSPSTTYRVLAAAGRLNRWNKTSSAKGTGFTQPTVAHEHWHTDIAYINIAGTFYYLCTVLDGFSRYVVQWDIREQMKEADVEQILQRAREQHPEAAARLISDNGPQFVSRDLRKYIRLVGMTHVFTSPYYPQSNGKIERYQRTLKQTAIRPRAPATLEEARGLVSEFVRSYNNERLHSAIGYVTPADMMAGRQKEIQSARDRKLETAREERAAKRKHQREAAA